MDFFDWIFIISITAVFYLVTKKRMKLVRNIGFILIALIIPLVLTLINNIMVQKDVKFLIYIILILSYLIIELILDLVLKFDFRSKKSTHVPYIILEYAACFSFVFGALSLNIVLGWVVSILFWILLAMLIYYIIYQKKHKS